MTDAREQQRKMVSEYVAKQAKLLDVKDPLRIRLRDIVLRALRRIGLLPERWRGHALDAQMRALTRKAASQLQAKPVSPAGTKPSPSPDLAQVQFSQEQVTAPQAGLRQERATGQKIADSRLTENPSGIPPQSPGLRGTSYSGSASENHFNPDGVVSAFVVRRRPRPQPLWGSFDLSSSPRAVASLQPWALGRNPFRILGL